MTVRRGSCVLLLLAGLASRLASQETSSNTTLDTLNGAIVRGTVYDSVAHSFLQNAVIQLLADSGQRRAISVTTDSRGAFELRGVPAGEYIAGFFHEAFDVLGVAPMAKRVRVAPRDTINLAFATPGARSVVGALCQRTIAPARDSSGVVLGFVRDADSGEPLARSNVAVTWPEIVVERRTVRNQRREVAVKTDAEGWFAVCGVPADADVALRAEAGNDSSGFVPVEVTSGGLVRQDLRVSRRNTTVALATDSVRGSGGAPDAAVTVRRGTARLIGTVVRPNGAPISGAQLSLWGSDAEGVTGEDGAFALAELPAGTYTLEVRFVGFLPKRIPVELAHGRTTNVLAVVSEPVPVLDAVVVYGKRTRPTRVAEMMERRKRGNGHYMTRDDIKGFAAFETTDLLRRVPGVRVIPTGKAGYMVLMRRDCVPILWVDGVRYDKLEDQQLAMPRPDEIAVMEVYNGPAQVPAQFSGINACGAVVIWTGE